MTSFEEEMVRAAHRLYRRYADEVVDGLGLCPWSVYARRTGHVDEQISLIGSPTQIEPVLGRIAAAASRSELEVILLIFPLLRLGLRAFERFVAEVRHLDAERHGARGVPFAMAAFHPDAELDLSDPERLIPFLRRTPDPTIQLVRQSVLERVRAPHPQGTSFVDVNLLDPEHLAQPEERSLRERIAAANWDTVTDTGVHAVQQMLDDIRRDRELTYAKIRERFPESRPPAPT